MSTETTVPSLLKRLAALIALNGEGHLQFQPEAGEILTLCQKIRALIQKDELCDDEIAVISLLYAGKQIPESIHIGGLSVQEVLRKLKDKGIAEIDTPQTRDIVGPLIVPVATLNKEFISNINQHSSSEALAPFDSTKHYLLSWFRFVKRIHTYRENERNQHPIHGLMSERSKKGGPNPTETERKFAREEEELIQRSQLGWERFPIERVVRQLHLSPNERKILLYVLMNELNSDHCTTEELLLLTSTDVIDGLDKDRLWRADSMLRR